MAEALHAAVASVLVQFAGDPGEEVGFQDLDGLRPTASRQAWRRTLTMHAVRKRPDFH